MNHKLARFTAREAPIAKPSSFTNHKPLHLKFTSHSLPNSAVFFIVLGDVSGGFTCSYNLLRANSTASLSGILVFKLFTSREIILSSESSSVFSKISWPFECSFLCLPPQFHQSTLPMFCLVCQMSYQVKKGQDEVPCLCTFANPYSLGGSADVDHNLVYRASLISSFFFMASYSLLFSLPIFMSRCLSDSTSN